MCHNTIVGTANDSDSMTLAVRHLIITADDVLMEGEELKQINEQIKYRYLVHSWSQLKLLPL